jgi:hypothetical protein
VRRPALPARGSAIVLLTLGLVLGAGCSSSSDSKSSSENTAPAPEDVLVSNAKVTAGLATLGTLVATTATQAKTDATAAKATATQASEQWEAIEGRIKKNDTSAYLEFEDALSDIRTGAADKDGAKVAKAAESIATITSAYLAKFPG